MGAIDPAPLSPDEHCAVHHFIRLHGRRPTREELCRELAARSAGSHPVGWPADGRLSLHGASAAGLAGAVRREVARVLARL